MNCVYKYQPRTVTKHCSINSQTLSKKYSVIHGWSSRRVCQSVSDSASSTTHATQSAHFSFD